MAALVVVEHNIVVAVAVQLDHEPRGEANDDDVGPNGCLLAELLPVHLPAFQVRPHAPFGRGHVLAQLSGAISLG